MYVAGLSFKKRGDIGTGSLCAFPVRSKEGHLYWPIQGGGVYWSPEIESAKRLGFRLSFKGGFRFVANCNCHPFDWVEPLYDYRRAIGSSGPGYPIKLGINSLYGKLAQRKGNGTYCNMIWAGLITAITRAKLNDAISESISNFGPGRIVMVATDALYSLDPLHSLECGERLGAWERNLLDGLFIVQPGLYWDPSKRKRKSRGLPGKFFEEAGRTEAFERAWLDYLGAASAGESAIAFPSCSVPFQNFTGLKLAIARGKPETAGVWKNETRTINFDFRNKRSFAAYREGHAITNPKLGGPLVLSVPHKDFLAAGGAEPWEAARLMLEDQPDYVDFSAPFTD